MAIWNILQHPKFTGQRAHSFLIDFSCSTSWSVSLQISWEVFYLGQLWVFDYLHPEHLASYLIHHEKTPSLRWRGHNRGHWKWARSVNGAHLACLHILTILAINPSETPRIVCTVVLYFFFFLDLSSWLTDFQPSPQSRRRSSLKLPSALLPMGRASWLQMNLWVSVRKLCHTRAYRACTLEKATW